MVWGGLHGLYLWVERFFRKDTARLTTAGTGIVIKVDKQSSNSNYLYVLLTFMLINITWVFFRASTFSQAGHLLQSMFSFSNNGRPLLATLDILKVAVIIPLMLLFHWLMRNTSVLKVADKASWVSLGFVWAVLVLFIVFAQESGSSFIYFQF